MHVHNGLCLTTFCNPFSQVQAALPSATLVDIALALDAFKQWGFSLSPDLSDEVLAASLDRMRQQPLGQGVEEAPSSLVLVQLLGGLMASGAPQISGEWLLVWSGLMDAGAVERLGGQSPGGPQVMLQLVEILAHEKMEGLRPNVK